MASNDEILQLPDWEQTEPLEGAPDFLKDDNWFNIDISADFLDFTEAYQPPRWTMQRDGIPFANMGELHIISGKAGHGKTNLMSQFIAAILSGKSGNTEYTQPSTVDHPIILYIDTEQGKDDTIAFKNRICTMAGLDYSKAYDNFKILRLRNTEKTNDRWKKILKAVWMVHPTDIFLDGALDIVNDYNDQKECQPVIFKCMKLSTHYDASLWMVLHENPMVDKLVGTLGSIAQRKVSEIFTVRKHKQAEEKKRVPGFPDIYFEVEQLKARGRDIPNWFFQVLPSVNGWGMPIEIDDTGATAIDPEEYKAQQERIEANDYLMNCPWTNVGCTYTDIDKYLRSKGVTSNRRIKKIFDVAMEAGIIYKNERGKYFYNGMNNTLPNDAPEALAFEKRDEDEEVPY